MTWLTAAPVPVHITGGPGPWDYVIGGCTILATVAAAVAIVLSMKAGNDLKRDRRQTFELGVIQEASVVFERNFKDPNLWGLVRVLPSTEFSALRELALSPKQFPGGTTEQDLIQAMDKSNAYQSAMVQRVRDEIQNGITARTR